MTVAHVKAAQPHEASHDATAARCHRRSTTIAMVMLLSACAGPVTVAAPPQPASLPLEEPSSLPAVATPTVTMTREQFVHIAAVVIEHNRKKNQAINELNRKLSLKTAEDDAAQARAAELLREVRLWRVLGPVGAVILGVIVGLVTHYAAPAR